MALTSEQSRLLKILAAIDGMDLETITAVINFMQAEGLITQLADKLETERPRNRREALSMIWELQGIPY